MTEGSAFSGVSFGYDTEKIYKQRNNEMCNKWSSYNEEFKMCDFNINTNPYGDINITGSTKDLLNDISVNNNMYIKYWAPSKAVQNCSYSGSGLPYPNEKVAFENSKNINAKIRGNA